MNEHTFPDDPTDPPSGRLDDDSATRLSVQWAEWLLEEIYRADHSWLLIWTLAHWIELVAEMMVERS